MASGHGRGRITQSSIDAVLQRSDLVDLAAGYTQLVQRGAEHLGRCPFHDERTPSFWVNGTKGVYHCFGCGASGDVITFLQQKQGLDFVESIELLADRYRIQLEFEEGGSGKPRQSKRRLYEVSDAAANFYEALLLNGASAGHVRDYLATRHIADATIRAFRLGFSPDGGTILVDKAMEKGFTKEELRDARLSTEGGKDFFRGRLMVPIIDRANRVIGFGARKLHEEQFGGKYMNSADGPLFHKKQTVFLAPGIADAAKQAGYVVVVEGYMDVIAMWQAGFRNTCAVMGTALTEEQVVELKRLAPRALFAFDPDAAGQVATLRALDQARAHDLDVRVVLLPDGEDPADVLHGDDGRARMEELLGGGVSLLHFRTSSLLGSVDLGDSGERDRIYNEAVELYRTVPDGPAKREQIVRLANALQLDAGASEALYATTGAAAPMRLSRPDSREPQWREQRALSDRAAMSPRSNALDREKRLLALALRRVELDAATDLSAVLPPEESFALAVHRQARAALIDSGADALAPARVRDDAALFQLVSELAVISQKAMLAADDFETLDNAIAELARLVEVQGLDRQLGELRARAADPTADDDALLIEQTQLRRRMRQLNPRLAE